MSFSAESMFKTHRRLILFIFWKYFSQINSDDLNVDQKVDHVHMRLIYVCMFIRNFFNLKDFMKRVNLVVKFSSGIKFLLFFSLSKY